MLSDVSSEALGAEIGERAAEVGCAALAEITAISAVIVRSIRFIGFKVLSLVVFVSSLFLQHAYPMVCIRIEAFTKAMARTRSIATSLSAW